jgi:predicted dehydrogenase
MINVCLIGGSGHVGLAFSGSHGRDDIRFTAVAPGSSHENVAWLMPRMKEFGGEPKYYSDYKKMLLTEKPDLVVTDNYFGDHAEVNKAVLESGCHLFAEKPLATSLELLESVQKAFLSAGVQMAAMLNYRARGSFYTAWQMIQSGSIGEIRLLNAQKSYKLGDRPSFMRERKTYGGTLTWVGIHGIDWISWMSGQKFISVTAAQSSLHNHGAGTLEMTALAQFRLTHEVMASLSADYHNPPQAILHGDDRIRIVGTDGVIEVINDTLRLTNRDAAGWQQIACQPDQELFSGFLDQIEGKGICRVSAADSFTATEAAIRAQMSADSAQTISFS